LASDTENPRMVNIHYAGATSRTLGRIAYTSNKKSASILLVFSGATIAEVYLSNVHF